MSGSSTRGSTRRIILAGGKFDYETFSRDLQNMTETQIQGFP